jgi:predicted dehydrogenase
MRSTRPIPRRRALAGLAATFAMPTIVPSSALGRAGRTAPGERLAVGVIGCGKMANDYHLTELLKFDDVQVAAVCEVDRTRREHAVRRVKSAYEGTRPGADCASYADYRELIGRDDIDAVCIATPEHQHALPALLAMGAGKDVYCEKPLTLTLAEAKACVDAARAHGRVFQTGSQQRSNVFGSFREAAEIVRSGRLGKVLVVTVGVGGPSRPCDLPGEPAEPGLEWDLWLGPAPERPYNAELSPRGVHRHFPAWRNYREYAGGGLADMGAHHFDIAQWCLGRDGSGPVAILPPDDERSRVGAMFRYDDGVLMLHGGPSGCTFTGTEGVLRVDRGLLQGLPEAIVKEPLGEKDVHLPKSPGHHRNWLDCIRSRETPVADVEIGARSVALPILGNLVYEHRRPLRWDPQAWRFVDDPEANRWLDRDRRPGWELPGA